MESLHAFRANSWFSKPLEASIHIMVSGQFPRYLTLYDALSSSGPDEIRKYYQSIIDILLYSNYSVSNRDALWRAIIESESTYERISYIYRGTKYTLILRFLNLMDMRKVSVTTRFGVR